MNRLSRLQVMNPLSHKNPKKSLLAVAAGACMVLVPLASPASPMANATSAAVAQNAPHASSSGAAASVKPVSLEALEPTGLYGDQTHIDPTPEQWSNAKTIVDVAVKDRKMSPYAAVVSVATALQESKLQNLNTAVDYDSLGLFQQRPSCGWGSPDQLVDPKYATNAFLDALQKTVPDYQQSPLWQVAQATQQSAFPTAYAQWQDMAAHMVQQILDGKH
jgi:hypothetical protein